MRVKAEIQTGIGALMAAHVLMAFGVMALLVRMSPAIEEVLLENVSSLSASEEMLAAVASRDCGMPLDQAEEQFAAAFDEARRNISVEGERLVLDDIERAWSRAMAGDCDARARVVRDIQEIADINRRQMQVSDDRARLLGAAGAWSVVLIGALAFGVGSALVARFTQKIAEPMGEIEAVLAAYGKNDPYRRCRRLPATTEYGEIAVRLNQILDRQIAREEGEDPALRRVDRALLLHLLDRMPEPAVAVDTSGAVLAASSSAMDILAAGGVVSLADALAIGPHDDEGGISLIQRVEPFGNGDGFVIGLRASKPPAGDPVSMLDDPPPQAASPATPTSPPLITSRVTSRPTLDPLADHGASETRAVPVPPSDGRPDWEKD